ncbi:hypothetical protein EDD11_002348 [Mortierella claussenii]|nr:hypothetical protein EDD11_002348 [Mortierella claussenii]
MVCGYRAQANESALTYDGVDICGQRLVQEIYSVVKVIEAGGNIEEMKGQMNKNKSSKKKQEMKRNNKATFTSPSSSLSPNNAESIPGSTAVTIGTGDIEERCDLIRQQDLSENLEDTTWPSSPPKRVTQLSYLGYSLGGLIGRFAMGMLELEGFFDRQNKDGQGIEPMYFVTMATPHLGIRQPPLSRRSKIFNYLSARMLSRTDGKPLLLVMSEPSSVFVSALKRFKRRVVYCNIRNDRSVPFWTASFSDADPFKELDSMDIQYNSGYSSLVESFEQQDLEAILRQKKERKETLKSASFRERTRLRLKAIPWKKYAFFGVLGPLLIPIWFVIAFSIISVQGLSSRRRTKPLMESNTTLERMRTEGLVTRISAIRDDAESEDESSSSSSDADAITHIHTDYTEPTATTIQVQSSQQNTQPDSCITLAIPSEPFDPEPTSVRTSAICHDNNTSKRKRTTMPSTSAPTSVVETLAGSEGLAPSEPDGGTKVSLSYPHMKQIQPLALMPVQIEISKNLDKLKWKKNIIHIEGMNAHASIVVRENRFSNDGGIAAVQHAVDMFKDDGEDE